MVFGYGFIPWEFQDGARPWVFPGLVAVIFRAASLAGIDDSLMLVSLARTAMAALALAGIAGAMRLAARLSDSPAAASTGALVAGTIAAFSPLTLVFDTRALAEAATAPLVVLGALLLLEKREVAVSRFRPFGAGVVVGVACFLRYQVGLVALGLAVVPLLRRRPRDVGAYALGGIAAACAGGALDWAIWGRPFHSLRVYASYHLQYAVGAHAGLEPLPAWWYAEVAWSSSAVGLLVTIAGLVVAAVRLPRTRAPLAAAALFLVAHAVLRQKEFRYLLSVAPLLAAIAGAGLGAAWDSLAPRIAPIWRARGPALAALVLGAMLAARSASASFAELGQYRGMDHGARSPWGFERDVNLLLHDAGKREDLCGLAMSHGRNMVWHGGYTYLHRDVPVLGLWDDPRLHLAPVVREAANYALVPASFPPLPGFTRVKEIGSGALLRREGGCVAHPELDDRNFERP